jgi:predicted transposase YdaD
MLDYYTRLKRQYWCDIEQVLIFLQATSSEIVFNTEYVDRKTRHEYRVIRLWEEDPTPLLANPHSYHWRRWLEPTHLKTY